MEELIDEWQWCQIRFCGNTEPYTPSVAHYIYGEESGMQWFVDLDRVNLQWIVTVTDGIRPMIRRIECTHEPTCGIDVADADRINGAIDEMKSELVSIVPWWKSFSGQKNYEKGRRRTKL